MVENITSKSKTWIYPRFVQMILDHAYPDLERDEKNDLLQLFHMDNEMLKVLARYHKNHPEPTTKAEFFGFIKDKNYVDPDPVDHQRWRNDKEMKEAEYAAELKILSNFRETRNELFVKEEKKKRSRKATPKVQKEEGSSSQPHKKRQKKVVETMLVDESEEEDEAEAEGDAEKDQDPVSLETEQILKDIDYGLETEKAAGEEGDDVENSSSSSFEEEIDETEQSQTPPSSGGRKKASARKRVISPQAARRKLIVKLPKCTPRSKPSQPPSPSPPPKPSPPKSPPKQPTPPQSPHQSPPHLSPLHLSPPHFSPPHQTPIQEQPVFTSPQIFQTPPSKQPHVQTTPGSSSLKDFPHIPVNIPLDDIGDFNFASDEQVRRLEKKVEEVLVENKKLVDREKKLEKRVKIVETENSSLLKKVETDQVEIDIMEVKIGELEDEKARRDEQNKYFKLKNKELETANARKEHEMFMINKVLENLIGTSIEQKFEEIQVEEVRARRQAEIDAEMKNKGKSVEGTSEVTERAIVPSAVSESLAQNPCPISAVSGIFEEDVHSDDDDDDDGQGGTCIKVSEASNEGNVDDYLHDDVNEEPESAEGEGENVDDKNVESERLILRLEPEVEEGEIRHTYTMAVIIKMTQIDDPNFKFDFEDELNAFDINQQPDYQYKYVEEADNYDRVEVEDCSDEESVNADASYFPTLVEFFSQENIDELRRKVEECLKDKNFDGTTKDESREERKKWLERAQNESLSGH
ncbi:neurofilament medium polypeptide-like [Helianthus annuus]|uniref:neurofilament medium polypeptide-like n=1 Tax=Helianthus annuus TaxID=4232 RepID=UPI000B8FE47D|nr:neurofilament medium polypeptide-like [Helianthus annuus]